MKNKFLLSLSVTALMTASCSKNEVSDINNFDADAIGFELSTGKTRAVVSNLGAIQSDAAGFGVYATNGTSAAMFIENKAYKYDAGEWKWEGQKNTWPKWPADETGFPIHFYAYYPLSSASSLNSALTHEYTIAATPAAQTDFLAANRKDVIARPGSSNVNLNFTHILSKIDFAVVKATNVAVELQSIAVNSVGNKRTFNFADLDWLAQPVAWGDKYNFMKAPAVAANKFEGDDTGGVVQGSDGSLMLMPQDLDGRAWEDWKIASLDAKSHIAVVYRVNERENGADILGYADATKHPDYEEKGNGITGGLFLKVAYSLDTNWGKSKAYTYSVYLGAPGASGGILIDDMFYDKDGNRTELPVIDPNTEEPLDPEKPIVDTEKPIGFVVDVEEWGRSVNNDLL